MYEGAVPRTGRSESMRGTMLWFNQVKDRGVITTENGEGLHVAGADFVSGERPQGRCAGAAVMFVVTGQNEARKAASVSFVLEEAPRRARMRHARNRSHG